MRLRRHSAILGYVILGLAFGIVVTLLIPNIRYSTLVEPTIHDVKPTEIFEKITASPDNYVLIDVRSPAEYKKLHARGAINIPAHVLYDERHNLPTNGKEIVLYCTGGRLSGVAYGYLEHFGFMNIARIQGGIEAWQSEGMPVVMGDLFQ